MSEGQADSVERTWLRRCDETVKIGYFSAFSEEFPCLRREFSRITTHQLKHN
jgi:hypothetical protein